MKKLASGIKLNMGSSNTDEIDVQDTQGENQFGSFKQTFAGGMIGQELLGKNNFVNPGNLLHNNIGQRVLAEQNMENDIFIDTTFRLFDYYQNPFKFDVKFNGTEATTDIRTLSISSSTFSYRKYVSGDPQIVFPHAMKNILRMSMHTLIMPKYINYGFVTDQYVAKTPELKKATKYLILKIKEVASSYKYSNNPYVDKGSFIMRHDSTRGENDYWMPMCGNVIFHASNLQNISRLSFEILDSDGELLHPQLDGVAHNFTQEYINLINSLKTATEQEKLAALPKMLSLRYITEVSCPELYISFTGIIPQLDTNPRY